MGKSLGKTIHDLRDAMEGRDIAVSEPRPVQSPAPVAEAPRPVQSPAPVAEAAHPVEEPKTDKA